VAAGHEVSGLARTPAKAAQLAALGAQGVHADPFDLRSLGTAFAGHDAVVNLMTHIPPAKEMARPGAWEENDRLRRVAAPLVAEAAAAVGVRRLVQESVTLLYADHG
jgi:uncharacterized protein YbjT (DUF2867 family)